ncbi:MAG: DUF2807 domain-containing protein, partial [Bacteroidota bacterium]
MKKVSINIVMMLLAFTISIPLVAQIRGNGEITKQSRSIDDFDGIKIDGASTVVLTQGDNYEVVVETDSNIQEYVTVDVKNNTLEFGFNTHKIKKYKILKFYVTVPNIKLIKVSGASDVNSTNVLTGDNLKIIVSGASDVDLNVDFKSIETKISGASDVTLAGTAISSVVESSGASDFHGKELITTSTIVKASGASSCFVNAKSNLNYQVSGAADVSYVSTPETVIIKKSKGSENVIVQTKYTTGNYPDADTTSVNIGTLNVTVVDGDTTQITVGRHTLVVTDDGDVSWKRCKVKRFNGHWGGFELGINGYVTPEFNTNWGKENDYLNLRYENSIAVNLNIYEQNISLNKNKTVGLVTGLGFSWNNYRFSNNTMLTTDNSELKGYYMEDVSVRKTKLTAMYLTIPLIFEVQTNHDRYLKRFHFAVGVVTKMRISTHTKVYFNEANKIYYLRDPGTDELLPTAYTTPNANSRNIVKNFDSFYLRPFKFDATVRLGYGIINLFATYSLNTMFQSGRGPE